MKYAPEKAIKENELKEVEAKRKAHFVKIRAEIQAGDRDPNDLDTPHDLYDAERKLKDEIEAFPPIYEVGDGITRQGYSDAYPYTVIAVNPKGNRIRVRACNAELDPTWKPKMHIGGFSANCSNQNSQRWNITENENGSEHVISLRKNGKWLSVGQSMNIRGDRWYPGRRRFYDYNF